MRPKISNRQLPLAWALCLWLCTTLACNAPVGQSTIPVRPTLIPSQATTLPTNELTPASTLPLLTPNPGALPTFTPIVESGTTPSQPTLAGFTPAPTVTIPGAATSETLTPLPQSGSLSFTYSLEWTISTENPFIAIALVTITAQGGDGHYTYYHDDLIQSGPVFTYEWAVCRDNPGSVRVDSGDGQSSRINYFEIPPCP
ncbi:MAG: hypothetical protein KA314_17755 [Chloroflexi bacterium]|nr:hypothetical protein [Chloroflexota bacterium]MBP8057678.1 hypothetical protein [Chloroflexota bacterium]